MRFRLLVGTVVVLAVTIFFTEHIYAANGDLIVNGNLGVGTTTPAAKAQVNGNMIVNGTITNNGETVNGNASVTGNLGVGTTTPTQKLDVNGKVKGTGLCIGASCTTTLHVSGGLYGLCSITGGDPTPYCAAVKSPATCAAAICSCPTGYTIVTLNAIGTFSYSCYKN